MAGRLLFNALRKCLVNKHMKALVIGGSNGIGLAIAIHLVKNGFFVEIVDREKPEEGNFEEESFEYHYCDLLNLNEDLITSFAKDQDINMLVITAGFGRVADFEFFHITEIRNMITVNTTSTIQILRLFYERIKTEKRFYTVVMGSVAGWLSSPSAALYAASKAAICRFVESVNIELEVFGTRNRILNVCPGSFKGSRFYGGKNQPDLLKELATDIIKHTMVSDALFIPQYEEIYQAIIERYQKDPHEYGLYSYQFKKESGRQDNVQRLIIGYLSGTFDLFHIGHLNLLRRAKQKCDYLIVGVHESGAWKGKETFIPFDERMEIVGACKYVDRVVKSCPEDTDAWSLWHYNRLFVGSDYKGSERFIRYEEYFRNKGVEIVYFPYTQTTNSTQIRDMIYLKKEDRPQEND